MKRIKRYILKRLGNKSDKNNEMEGLLKDDLAELSEEEFDMIEQDPVLQQQKNADVEGGLINQEIKHVEESAVKNQTD